MAGLSSDNEELIVRIEHILSFFCSAFILFSYFKFKDLRGPAFTLVFFLSASDAMLNLITLFPSAGTDLSFPCILHGVLLAFFLCASALWSLVISLMIHSSVLNALARPRHRLHKFISRPVAVHKSVWGISMVLALLPLTTNSMGYHQPDMYYCWLRLETPWDWFWSYFTADGLVWLVVCCALFISCRTRWEIRAVMELLAMNGFREKNAEGESQKEAGYKKLIDFYDSLRLYPVVLAVAWAPTTIIRLLKVLDVSVPLRLAGFFKFFTGIFLQGILNAFVFGFTPAVRQRWVELFTRVRTTKSISPVLHLDGSLIGTFRESLIEFSEYSLGGFEGRSLSYFDNPWASEVELRRTSESPLSVVRESTEV